MTDDSFRSALHAKRPPTANQQPEITEAHVNEAVEALRASVFDPLRAAGVRPVGFDWEWEMGVVASAFTPYFNDGDPCVFKLRAYWLGAVRHGTDLDGFVESNTAYYEIDSVEEKESFPLYIPHDERYLELYEWPTERRSTPLAKVMLKAGLVVPDGFELPESFPTTYGLERWLQALAYGSDVGVCITETRCAYTQDIDHD